MKKLKDYIINFINGFCMALADSVPGVSGGTIAFILGFYEKLVVALDNLFHGNFNKKKEALKYLFKIMIGWVIGLLLSILILANLFTKNIYLLTSLFLGFIIFAIPLVIKEEKEQLKGKYYNIIFLLIGLFLVGVITYLNHSNGLKIDLNSFSIGTIIYVFLAASLAISAMILPGMSGSTLLLIFGLYIPIVNAIKEVIHFNFNSIGIVIVFGLGMIFGILTFIKLMKKSLEKRRSVTIYLILGMMLGSIYSIIMGPTTLDIPKEPLSFSTFNILFFILGGILIFGLEYLKKILNNK